MVKIDIEYDYIIVGAGSAGCVLANRLTSNSKNTVLLLEAGGEDKSLTLKMPAAVLSNLKSTKHNWAFKGEPEPELNGRQLQHDRGKTLGGSSSINGMVYIRGNTLDYEGWRQMGCDGWGYADVLPYFKKMECYSGGGDDFRGGSGPLKVHRSIPKDPLSLAFINAGKEAGYKETDDISGFCQEGFGIFDRTVFNGERWSASKGYLDPIRNRKNLTIFFSDIVNFTDLSDSLEAEKLALILNNYLSEMSLIAINSNATIDKFIGDAILSFHGAPETLGDENDAINCISMALEMKERVKELQSFWIRQGVKGGLKVRYGISSGFANVGDFGSSVMSDYTAIGSSVNLASRLQSIAPENEIIISDTTYNLVKNQIKCEEYEEITPKGFVRPVKTYKVIDFKNKKQVKNKDLLEYYNQVVKMRDEDEYTLPSTIEKELNINPFLRSAEEEVRKSAEIYSSQAKLSDIDVLATIRAWKDNF